MAAIAGVERRFTHQAVHTRFSAQPTKGVVTLNMTRRALDTGYFACRYFDQIRFKAVCFAPTQIHAQQHFGPILCFCAAAARLDIQVGVVHVHFAAEHATEFEVFQCFNQLFDVVLDFRQGVLVVFFHGQFEEVLDIRYALVELVYGANGVFQSTALLAELLGVFWFVPDFCVTQFQLYFL